MLHSIWRRIPWKLICTYITYLGVSAAFRTAQINGGNRRTFLISHLIDFANSCLESLQVLVTNRQPKPHNIATVMRNKVIDQMKLTDLYIPKSMTLNIFRLSRISCIFCVILSCAIHSNHWMTYQIASNSQLKKIFMNTNMHTVKLKLT